MTKQLAKLPQDKVDALKKYRHDDQNKFLTEISSLRANNWPLRAIAEPLGVSRTTVLNWQASSKELINDSHNTFRPHPLSYGAGVQIVQIPRDINSTSRKRLAELSRLAKKRTRWSTPTSAETQASNELDNLLLFYRERKVPCSTLARHMGVTRRAVIQRLEKVGV